MWEPQHLTALWVSTARYRDTFTFISYDINKGSQYNPLDERMLALVNYIYFKSTVLKLTTNVGNVTLAVVT
jgi:hypothetical protein